MFRVPVLFFWNSFGKHNAMAKNNNIIRHKSYNQVMLSLPRLWARHNSIPAYRQLFEFDLPSEMHLITSFYTCDLFLIQSNLLLFWWKFSPQCDDFLPVMCRVTNSKQMKKEQERVFRNFQISFLFPFIKKKNINNNNNNNSNNKITSLCWHLVSLLIQTWLRLLACQSFKNLLFYLF